MLIIQNCQTKINLLRISVISLFFKIKKATLGMADNLSSAMTKIFANQLTLHMDAILCTNMRVLEKRMSHMDTILQKLQHKIEGQKIQQIASKMSNIQYAINNIKLDMQQQDQKRDFLQKMMEKNHQKMLQRFEKMGKNNLDIQESINILKSNVKKEFYSINILIDNLKVDSKNTMAFNTALQLNKIEAAINNNFNFIKNQLEIVQQRQISQVKSLQLNGNFINISTDLSNANKQIGQLSKNLNRFEKQTKSYQEKFLSQFQGRLTSKIPKMFSSLENNLANFQEKNASAIKALKKEFQKMLNQNKQVSRQIQTISKHTQILIMEQKAELRKQIADYNSILQEKIDGFRNETADNFTKQDRKIQRVEARISKQMELLSIQDMRLNELFRSQEKSVDNKLLANSIQIDENRSTLNQQISEIKNKQYDMQNQVEKIERNYNYIKATVEEVFQRKQ